jgi:hypothetical protein
LGAWGDNSFHRAAKVNLRARQDMEWWMVRVLLIFRVIHLIQIAFAIPGESTQITQHIPALVALLLIFVESVFVIDRFRRKQGYGGVPTAVVEISTAIIVLLTFAFILPDGNRVNLATPLVDLTTEQITGVAIGSAIDVPWQFLAGGTLAVTASYVVLIGTGQPAALGTPGALIGATGIVALAILIRIGGERLLMVAAQVETLSREQQERQQLEKLGVELHNHLFFELAMLERLDHAESTGIAQARENVLAAGARLLEYVNTGRFHGKQSLASMIMSQVEFAGADGLWVELVVMPDELLATLPSIGEAHLDAMERALRAVLINVRRHAHVNHAVLRVRTATADSGGRVLELLVADRGDGFPPGIYGDDGRLGGRSLSGRQAELQRIGGDLWVLSEGGSTAVAITVPLADRPASEGS